MDAYQFHICLLSSVRPWSFTLFFFGGGIWSPKSLEISGKMDLIYKKMLTHGLYSRSGRNWAEE